MSRLLALFLAHWAVYWFADLFLAVALLLGVLLLLRRRRQGTWPPGLAVAVAAFTLAGVGGLALPFWWGLGVVSGALALLAGMIVVLLLSGSWSAYLGWAAGALLVLGLGGLVSVPVGETLAGPLNLIGGLEFTQPLWLALLLFIPLVVVFSYRSLAGLGPVRRWVSIGLRSALILLVVLALAEARLRNQKEIMTVLFAVDRSLSVPEEFEPNPRGGTPIDLRWERIKRFINDSVRFRGPGHERDKAGLIVFGKRSRLELPPSDAPAFNFTEISGDIDGNYTNIAAAIRQARASFPENTGQRIVLISDGNENLGDAEAEAIAARDKGVQIDVVPLAAGQKHENEILVQSVEAPPLVEQGSQLPLRVLIRSMNPHIVVGKLTVKQIARGQAVDVPGSPREHVALQPGLNAFLFKQGVTGGEGRDSLTYRAEFQPESVRDEKGNVLARGLPGDRPQNNTAETHVVAHGQRRVLLIEPKRGDHALLVAELEARGKSKFVIDTLSVDTLPLEKDKLAVLLSNYDSVVLANVAASNIAEGDVGNDRAAETITEAQQDVIHSNTHDQGCGLIMIGGPNSFGAGGWQNTAVEKALPVDCEVKSMEVEGRGGLVLIMHASEIAQGNYWQKQIAKLAIQKLNSNDMVGMIYYDHFGPRHRWHIPFGPVGERRVALMGMVDRMQPGDMPDVDPAFKMAVDELRNPKHQLATRHIIFISDGDHWEAGRAAGDPMPAMRSNPRITCTTVCVTSHGNTERQKMQAIATYTGGRFYNVTNPAALPAIYIKETRLVAQSVVYERQFTPHVNFRLGPAEGLPETLPSLYGFVRTTRKPSELVEMPIQTPSIAGQTFPILAYWHYGLGKSVAFTSDARTQPGKRFWDRDWADSPMYAKFWEQAIDWSLRPVDSKRLVMTTEQRDGKVRVIIDARDENGKPLINLKLQGKVTTPSAQIDEKGLEFKQTNSGVYEAEFKAEEAGSYFIAVQHTRKVKKFDKDGKPLKDKNGKEIEVEESESVRGGVTIPYSPEFADLETNISLLEKIRAATGGNTYKDDDEKLATVAKSGEVFRPGPPSFRGSKPIWFWLLVAAGVLLFFDVAVRRIAIDPSEVATAARGVWDRLRGRAVVRPRDEDYFEKLRSRKAQVGETLERGKPGRRFEGGAASTTAPPPGAGETPAAPPRPAPRPAAQREPERQQKEGDDYASRLLRAKRRALRDKEKDKE
jgi:uncharacterized membrane protein